MEAERLKELGLIREYKYNDVICMEGDVGDTAFLLLSGSVDVYIGSYNNKPKKIATLKVGSFFGEMSLLENKPRTATIMAKQGVTVLVIEKDNFRKILCADHVIAYRLFQTLKNRLDDTLAGVTRTQIGFAAELERNEMYQSIKKISEEQFSQILDVNSEHAEQMLRFMSGHLSKLDARIASIPDYKDRR